MNININNSSSNNNNKYKKAVTDQLGTMLLANKPPEKPSSLVCAKNGVAGIGPLTDHGAHKLHGWYREDYKLTHNPRRAANFWKFRTYCLNNLGIVESAAASNNTTTTTTTTSPFRIVFFRTVVQCAGTEFGFFATCRSLAPEPFRKWSSSTR
jgi:hypothetical protein